MDQYNWLFVSLTKVLKRKLGLFYSPPLMISNKQQWHYSGSCYMFLDCLARLSKILSIWLNAITFQFFAMFALICDFWSHTMDQFQYHMVDLFTLWQKPVESKQEINIMLRLSLSTSAWILKSLTIITLFVGMTKID